MKYFGCKDYFLSELRKQPHVDISVAFLLIKLPSHTIVTTATSEEHQANASTPRLALIQDGHLVPTNLLAPMVLPARLVRLDSKTPTCSLLTLLHKAGAGLGLVLLDLVDLAWDTRLKDGSHLGRLSRPTGLVPGTTTPSLLARLVARQVLPACSSKGSSSDRHQECHPTPCHLRRTTSQHPLVEPQTCPEALVQLLLRCPRSLAISHRPQPQRPRLRWRLSRPQKRSRSRLPCWKTRSLQRHQPQASRFPRAPRA